MSTLFLDVLGNGKLVDGYQIDDAIAQKYNLKPGTICPFTHLRVEILSPRQVREVEEAERQKKIKQKKKALGKEKQEFESHFAQKKEKLSAVDGKISGYAYELQESNKLRPDVFVSVHNNGGTRRHACWGFIHEGDVYEQ